MRLDAFFPGGWKRLFLIADEAGECFGWEGGRWKVRGGLEKTREGMASEGREGDVKAKMMDGAEAQKQGRQAAAQVTVEDSAPDANGHAAVRAVKEEGTVSRG